MDYIIFNQPGGFPLTTNILEYLQTFHKPKINALASMAGSKAIINGCEEEGAKVLGGNIVIDGEMYGLIEGIKQEYITIKEDKQTVEFENGENKATIIYRYAVFGTGANSYKWSDFKRVPFLNELPSKIDQKADNTRVESLEKRIEIQEKLNAPDESSGTIKIWCKPVNQIPAGWVSADEFVGRMLMGLNPSDPDFNTVGKTGGSKTHTMTIDELPPHSHAIWGQDNSATPKGWASNEVANIETPGNFFNKPTDITGKGVAMNIMNPYSIVIFIKWVGIGNGING